MLPAKPEPMPGHWRVTPGGGNLWLALDRPHHPARVRIITAVVVPCRCGMPSGSRNAIGPVDRYGGRPSSAASHCGGVPGIVNSGSPAACSIQWQPSATAWSSCALLSWSTGIRRGSSSGAGPRRAGRILSGQPGERAALTATQGVHVAQAVAPPPGCHPDRRAATETWGLSCRGRRRHDFPGEHARAGDHDTLPGGAADREGIGVTLFENAQDVGDLFAAIRAAPAPADHDPLADIGGPLAGSALVTCSGARRFPPAGRAGHGRAGGLPGPARAECVAVVFSAGIGGRVSVRAASARVMGQDTIAVTARRCNPRRIRCRRAAGRSWRRRRVSRAGRRTWRSRR